MITRGQPKLDRGYQRRASITTERLKACEPKHSWPWKCHRTNRGHPVTSDRWPPKPADAIIDKRRAPASHATRIPGLTSDRWTQQTDTFLTHPFFALPTWICSTLRNETDSGKVLWKTNNDNNNNNSQKRVSRRTPQPHTHFELKPVTKQSLMKVPKQGKTRLWHVLLHESEHNCDIQERDAV